MVKPTPPEDLIIPPQDTRICGIICVCQMTAVLSSVAIVYLTVAVYTPTMRAFQSGISDVPAMCTTTLLRTNETCQWVTCTEWCLSKGAGTCQQIFVNLRRNGSTLIFANCTNSANKTCYGIDQEKAKPSICIQDHCKNLTGTFNCTKGSCINITDAFECLFTETEPPLKCSGRRGKITCMDIEGLQSCDRGTCERILTPYNCDRKCSGIPTRHKNMIVLSGDRVYLSQCAKVIDKETGEEVWDEGKDNIVMTSCYEVTYANGAFEASDCINGSILDKDVLDDFANFTYLTYLSVINTNPLDQRRVVAPPEIDLLLSNDSGLMINFEGCVNTLMDECKEFFKVYGKDGSDHNARARFPCFYSDGDLSKAVVRFDLEATYNLFLFASLLPSILLLVSCSVLATCQKTVEVGDDAKMRFKGCNANVITAPGEKGASLSDIGDGGGTAAMAL